MYASVVLGGSETLVVPPVSSSNVNKLVVFGERLDSGRIKSDVFGVGKSLVGA